MSIQRTCDLSAILIILIKTFNQQSLIVSEQSWQSSLQAMRFVLPLKYVNY